MTYVLVHCPDCQGVDVVRYGKQRHGPQRYCWGIRFRRDTLLPQ